MHELTDPRWIKLEGLLFLASGLSSGTLLLMERFSLKDAVLFALSVWAFCRFYYCAFHVIERYEKTRTDP